jgi:CheY-like chemotaxis protein
MRGSPVYNENAEEKAIHSYYNKILNLMPFLVYWVDESCKLQGFNAKFGKILNIFSPNECRSNFYAKLSEYLTLKAKEAEILKIEDMQVIFSGKHKHNQLVSTTAKADNIKSYIINRDPILSENGNVIGAVIVIIENKPVIGTLQKFKPVKSKSFSTKKPKVLIVEDNETAKKVATNLFENLNCKVDAVNSGAEAMNIFKPGKYSLVIMDIGLADSSGYLLSRKFREMEEKTKHHTAIIALTSYKPENVKNDCIFYKMEGVVAKPLSEEQANQIIERFVYKSENMIDGFT